MEDERLLAHLVERQVPLEVCPSSNVCTNVFGSLAEHAIGQLIAAGAFVPINTDDPPMFSTTLTDEYLRVADAFDLDLDTVVALCRNGVTASFMPAALRAQLLSEIDEVARHCR